MAVEFTTPRADEYLALLTKRLPGKTLNHVQSVARFMLTFSHEAKISKEQAVTAGLLHDLCKAYTKVELRLKAEDYNLKEHLDTPNLLHGPVAAVECRIDLGVTDEDVLEAIEFHTTGKGNWNAVGCALYIADFAEPLRTRPEAARAREILTSEGYYATLDFVAKTRSEFTREKHGVNEDTEAFITWLNAKA
jgi:predicted HD superfamily hydrolase involved in NAD metabolism